MTKLRAGAERADFGHFRRAEALRKCKLAFAADILAAKQQHRMLLERGAHRCIDRIIGGNVRKRHAAKFGGKTRTKRDDVHRRYPPRSSSLPDFPAIPHDGQCDSQRRYLCAGRGMAGSPRSQNRPAIRPRPSARDRRQQMLVRRVLRTAGIGMRHPDRFQLQHVGENIVRQRAAEIGQDGRRIAGRALQRHP